MITASIIVAAIAFGMLTLASMFDKKDTETPLAFIGVCSALETVALILSAIKVNGGF